MLVSNAALVKGVRVLRSLPQCHHSPILVEPLFEFTHVLNRTIPSYTGSSQCDDIRIQRAICRQGVKAGMGYLMTLRGDVDHPCIYTC